MKIEDLWMSLRSVIVKREEYHNLSHVRHFTILDISLCSNYLF
ncbi:hypothetical protein D1AOALGA4SA_1126 [Olavius algarvensis Delta 1 endosymbiont]|nr:hypothetical protein D1AOALGA4SA_1126 [Olavius algarvensis Delta 1 endosymbiont]